MYIVLTDARDFVSGAVLLGLRPRTFVARNQSLGSQPRI